MGLKVADNAVTLLTVAVNGTTDTDFVITGADDALLPIIPTVGADYFYITLEDENHNIEIVKINQHVSASNTLKATSFSNRGLNGAARAWPIGSVLECRPVKLIIEDLLALIATAQNTANAESIAAAHIADTTAAHAASAIGYAGSANLSATDVEAALDELDTEKAGIALKNIFTKAQGSDQVALTDAANIATDASLSNVFSVTLGGNRTLDNPTNLTAGFTYIWNIKQDGTGSRTLAYGNLFKFPGGVAPVLSTAANAADSLQAVYDGTILRCAMTKDFR